MAESVRLKQELEATKNELVAASAQVASLQQQIAVRSETNVCKYAVISAATAVLLMLITTLKISLLCQANPRPPHLSNPQTTTMALLRKKKSSFLSRPSCKKLAKYQADLRQLGFDSGRILDFHYPAKDVAAILIHPDYSDDFHKLLDKHQVAPLPDFNHFAAANLNNITFASLDDLARADKAKALQLVRLTRGIPHVRPYLRGAVAHDFVQQDYNDDLFGVAMDSQPSASNFPSPLALAIGDTHFASAGIVFESSSPSSSLSSTYPPRALNITTWNANGLVRQIVNTFTGYLRKRGSYPLSAFQPLGNSSILMVNAFQAFLNTHTVVSKDDNTILCGDFNARSMVLLGDTATYARGSWLHDYIIFNGLFCWNAILAYGILTLSSPSCMAKAQVDHTSWNSIVELIIGYSQPIDLKMTTHDANLGSDHTFFCNRNSHASTQASTYLHRMAPNVDILADRHTRAIHQSLDGSAGRKTPSGPLGNARFWTDSLQDLAELPLKSRPNAIWKELCHKLSNGSFTDSTATIKRISHNRTATAGFSHPDGPNAAARTMANHLLHVFAGDHLPEQHPTAP
ncbi:hypothetical protein [Parasitella parasitica]|uniref:Endonuclease/exonuclease/phosphatase domain-containing protein n=1 Tax=Parasitella parasitica TaxID=35722 RepID=A0A0B7MNB9_9FUNG|nr:hypothetical protein [Parasitella parasitica]